MVEVHQLKIRLNESGMGTVELDGRPLLNVVDIKFHATAGEITHTEIHLLTTVDAEMPIEVDEE